MKMNSASATRAIVPGPINELRREHANMRSVLMLIRDQLDAIRSDWRGDYVLLANALYYMRRYPSVVHHPKEDMILKKLLAADPGLKEDVSRLLRQHQDIYSLEELLLELALNSPKQGSETQHRLLNLGWQYLQLQKEHSEREEQMFFPLAEKLLTPKDWAAIARKSKELDDPVFGTHSGDRYQMLYDHLMRESAVS